jgi:hypothetical protein
MAAVGKNNLCSLAYDGSWDTETSPPDRPAGGSPAEKVKAWLRQNLPPEKVQELEAFMASLQGEGQDEVDVRGTGEGWGAGSARREAGDPVGEDEDGDVPDVRWMRGAGPASLRGKRVPIYPNAGNVAQALDQMRRTHIWPGGRLMTSAEVAQMVTNDLVRAGHVRPSPRPAPMAYDRKWPMASREVEGTTARRPAWTPAPPDYDEHWGPAASKTGSDV